MAKSVSSLVIAFVASSASLKALPAAAIGFADFNTAPNAAASNATPAMATATHSCR
ncbi:hypothetical protein [Chryseobacterium taeanense]|uniref:hypothetical protein n=1 Tax=Chryseobacterium taeanense TaxID=311334 RepID=UPI0035B3FC71